MCTVKYCMFDETKRLHDSSRMQHRFIVSQSLPARPTCAFGSCALNPPDPPPPRWGTSLRCPSEHSANVSACITLGRALSSQQRLEQMCCTVLCCIVQALKFRKTKKTLANYRLCIDELKKNVPTNLPFCC